MRVSALRCAPFVHSDAGCTAHQSASSVRRDGFERPGRGLPTKKTWRSADLEVKLPSRATADRDVLSALWRTRSTTANAAGTGETFRVTHPYHPLFGREYKLITYCHSWGSHRVYFHDDADRLRKIPACWTDVVADDPFVVVAAGRSAFRVADMLSLADLVDVLQPRRRDRRHPANVSR
jgi:Family of unknown function (DUF5372)